MSPPTDAEIDALWRLHRPYLIDLAFRMLGNVHDAEDVVQVAFSRMLDVDLATIADVRGWLNVVVSRLCLDQLKSARSRHEAGAGLPDEAMLPASNAGAKVSSAALENDPADRVTLDDSLRLALVVVLEQLSPPERAVFVLHDVFQFPFDAVAEIVGRSAANCRQIASRARRRVQSETEPGRFRAGKGEQHDVVERFIAACGGGDVEDLMRLLDPDVAGQVELGAGGLRPSPLHGAPAVAAALLTFFGPTSGSTLVSQPLNGRPGVLVYRRRRLAAAVVFQVRAGVIYDIHTVADPALMVHARASQ
ncbi:MAG TPA: sigma-70 family RNA polymerase sigma factor [Acidimicrobiales bacterium]|jgi:RNA polymerase sigma-70 factor (ECF subfamily)|nr:sigma-70 family RNA polymerase sigma factor [Acidimicrobiales bacterium]